MIKMMMINDFIISIIQAKKINILILNFFSSWPVYFDHGKHDLHNGNNHDGYYDFFMMMMAILMIMAVILMLMFRFRQIGCWWWNRRPASSWNDYDNDDDDHGDGDDDERENLLPVEMMEAGMEDPQSFASSGDLYQ